MSETILVMGLWKAHFHWSVLLDWVVLGWIITTVLAIGSLLLVFDQFTGANVCFAIAAFFVFAKIVNVAAMSADPVWQRLLFTFLLFGIVGAATVETIRGVNNWRTKRQQAEIHIGGHPNTAPTATPSNDNIKSQTSATPVPKKSPAEALPVLSPYVRTESFIIDVPYYGAEDGFPISSTWQEDYPLNEAYSCISLILVLYAQAPPGTGIKQISTLDTKDKRAEALAEALRYCLIDETYKSERGSTKFGISATKGSIADYKPAIMPPHSIDYPVERFLTLLGTLPFGKNERIQMLYRRPLRVPEGSNVELLVAKIDDNDVVDHRIFRMSRQEVFSLAFGVAPINAAAGVLPEGFPSRFRPQQPKFTTYSFAITMKVEIQRTPTNASDVEDFKHWSDGLWIAIRDKYDIKRQK